MQNMHIFQISFSHVVLVYFGYLPRFYLLFRLLPSTAFTETISYVCIFFLPFILSTINKILFISIVLAYQQMPYSAWLDTIRGKWKNVFVFFFK